MRQADIFPVIDPAALIITRMARAVALVVAVSLPVGYGLTAVGDARKSLEFKASVKASALNALIASNPDVWQFAENRVQGLISRAPVPLENELVQVVDVQGNLVAQNGIEPVAPVMRSRYPLFDSDRVVGYVSVSGSQRELAYGTVAAAFFGLLLGALVILIMRWLPLRALHRATEALAEEKSRAEATLRSIKDAVVTTDAQGYMRQMNPSWLAMIEADSLEQMVGRPMLDVIAPEYRADYAELHRQVLAGASMEMQFEMLGLKGGRRWLETHDVPLQIHGDKMHLSVKRDITERKAAEDKIRNLAFYDSLTGLPNRQLLIDRLTHANASRSRSARYRALLFIDLDHFKILNDTLGHDMGDLLLQQVAKRLVSCAREGDTVARLGGDEFVVVAEDLDENAEKAAANARTLGGKILGILNQAYLISNRRQHSSASIGVTLFSKQPGPIGDLLKQADLAMYQAKAAGRNTLCFFDPAMQAKVTTRAALESELREAIEGNQFLLYYQPQITAAGHLMGAEVLIRWRHPQRGVVSPAEFIPLAEETGMILQIGHWVLDTACRQLALWAARPEFAHFTISVNVSSIQFKQKDFVDEVLAVLNDNGVNPQRLKLELTESLLVNDVTDLNTKMTALKSSGVGFSLDDFGTGYSSLSHLKLLPLDQLKIDRSFVRDILDDPNDAAIARMIINLGESLGLIVIAEGVETVAQRSLLENLGCHAYQGDLYGCPVPLEEFEALCSEFNPHLMTA